MTELKRREHPRYAIELDAEIEVAGERVGGRTRDLSRGGFCMLAQAPLPIGAECRVQLSLVFSENQFSEHLVLPATIIWCTPTQGAHQVGIKFGALEPQSRGYLDLFMQFLDAGEDESEE